MKKSTPIFSSTVLAILIGMSSTVSAAPDKRIYENANYGYLVELPKGVSIDIPSPPPTDGVGFTVTLGPKRTIAVYAQFDAVPYGSADAALRMQARWDHVSFHPERSFIGSRHYVIDTIETISSQRFIQIGDVYRTLRGGTNIIYTFELRTDKAHSKIDRGVLARIEKGFLETPYR